MDSADKTYSLLAEITQSSPSRGLTTHGVATNDPRVMQDLTTTYITTLYYSALSNLYIQNVLPEDIEEMPRLKIAFERTYNDYHAAAKWLLENGGEYINTSTARWYYEEIK